jgi:hypothetical protein
MNTVADEGLYTEGQREEVIRLYEDGIKVRVIEAQTGVDRAGIAWILEMAGAGPKRYRRAEKLRGNRQQMAHLFDHIKRQDTRIVQLEGFIRDECGLEVPPPPPPETH